MALPKVAILDDYQGVALQSADWSPLKGKADLTVFRDHLSSLDAVAARLAPFDVVCAMRERTPFPEALFARLPNLKLIVSTGKRNAAIDLRAAQQRGVVVSATTYVGHGAAELTWALILAAAKRIPEENAAFRAGQWQVSIGLDLKGNTLGLLGLGHLGGLVARYAHAFDMNVIAWSPNLREEQAREHGVRYVSKEDLFSHSDILSLHLVLSERTRGIVTEADLNRMKPTALFVNTSRGPLVDEAALIRTLENRTIAGAALDVFDEEPLPLDHPFRRLPNVLATPHIGFVTEETYRIFYRDTVEAILAWLDGKPVRVLLPPA